MYLNRWINKLKRYMEWNLRRRSGYCCSICCLNPLILKIKNHFHSKFNKIFSIKFCFVSRYHFPFPNKLKLCAFQWRMAKNITVILILRFFIFFYTKYFGVIFKTIVYTLLSRQDNFNLYLWNVVITIYQY